MTEVSTEPVRGDPVIISKDAARKRAQRHVPMVEACQQCGVTGVQLGRHHHDYQKPLDVVMVCWSCHAAADQKEGFRSVRPVKACAVCCASFSNYSHSRVKTCGKECLSVLGRHNANKRWHPGGQTAQVKGGFAPC